MLKCLSQNPSFLQVKSLRAIKQIADINLNGDEIKANPLELGTRKSCPFSMYMLNIVLEFIVTVIKQLKEIKLIQLGK